MKTESIFTEYVLNTQFDELPQSVINIIKSLILINLGCLIAGASLDECKNLVNIIKEWGGKPEATILVHNVKAPVYNTAFANSTMCRVLDFGDAIGPGIHIGPVAIPASLTAAELAGGCSGKEFLTSLSVGVEMASRLNRLNLKGRLGTYNGFKPTGVCAIFAGTAAAGRILGLNPEQMLNALALVFNRAGGSLQSNIDGAQAVALVAGFAAQNSMMCTQLARGGFTGPRNFLEGPYGYFHLYAKDNYDTQTVVGNLGKRFELMNTLFKQYPHCGLIQTSTQAILELVRDEGLTPENVSGIIVRVQPLTYKEVGHFEIGDSPKQSAQFSIQYCVASALLRKSSQFQHFEESCIRDPRILPIIKKIDVISTPAMEEREQTAVDMEVKTKEGTVYHKSIDAPRGSPGDPMAKEEYIALFRQCVNYGNIPWLKEKTDSIISMVERLEEVDDIRALISLFTN
jgi:2-methylcitrate dehydratase PrpD